MRTPTPSSLEFSPTEDAALLRQWVKRVLQAEGVSLPALAAQLQQFNPPHGAMSLSTLTRFLKETHQQLHTSTRQQMRGLWALLASTPEYVRHFADLAPSSERFLSAMFSSPDDLLAYALRKFFEDGPVHAYTGDAVRTRFSGKYVMYRLDLEPAQRNWTDQKTIRVSLIEIESSGHTVKIRETQNFEGTALREPHHQTNSGVLVPYGKFLLAIFRTPGRESFKCMVVEHHVPFFTDVPVHEFTGKLLVASALASFPSVRFICRRARVNDMHGIYRYEDIDRNILSVLTSPTFENHPITS